MCGGGEGLVVGLDDLERWSIQILPKPRGGQI